MSALSDPPTMAFLCRADLQLSPGKLAVQCAHAAVGSLKQAKKTHSRMVQRWSESASRKVCLAVEDEDELEYYLATGSRSISPIRSHKRCWTDRGCTRNSHRSWCWARTETYDGFSFQEFESIRMRSYDGFSKFSSSTDCS